MLTLREMRPADIEDYVRWFTVETEWMRWDAPWEPEEETTPEEARAAWTLHCEQQRSLAPDAPRRKYEIEADGRHIGWVCAYTDMDYFINSAGLPAVGIDIPDPGERGRGYGAEALRQFLALLRAQGWPQVYLQTWSGNERMLCLADKLGFDEVCRIPGMREVAGARYDALTLACRL